MATTIIQIPLPPGFGSATSPPQPIDRKASVTIGSAGNEWTLNQSGYYVYTFQHNFETFDFLIESYIEQGENSGLTVIPGVKRIDLNTAEISWNQNELLVVTLLRVNTVFA